MFRFTKKRFFIGSLFLSNLVSTTSLICISMCNQECKARPEIINISSNYPVFYPFSIKQVNVVTIVIILMIPTQKYVFLMLQKILTLKYLI